ncbi:hypothetical protein SNEBB_001330 [Seison nebaliae]|nr:hypothetical protein SNEBB_001330 [Seison nebaliae]
MPLSKSKEDHGLQLLISAQRNMIKALDIAADSYSSIGKERRTKKYSYSCNKEFVDTINNAEKDAFNYIYTYIQRSTIFDGTSHIYHEMNEFNTTKMFVKNISNSIKKSKNELDIYFRKMNDLKDENMIQSELINRINSTILPNSDELLFDKKNDMNDDSDENMSSNNSFDHQMDDYDDDDDEMSIIDE